MNTLPRPGNIPKLAASKAHRIIGVLCMASYVKANTRKNGRRYKKHRPYSVPEEAQDIIDCLNRDDEPTLKAIFMERNALGK